jgi:hypothetical protein
MSGGDWTYSNTQVPVIRCAWVPVSLSYHSRHSMSLSPKDSALVALPGTENPQALYPRAWLHFEPGHMEDL